MILRPPVSTLNTAHFPYPTLFRSPLPRPTGRLQIVAIPTPLPLPGQLKELETPRRPATISNPKDRVVHANAAARVQPDRTSWLNAIQQSPYADGALYQIYGAPGQEIGRASCRERVCQYV